MIQDGGVIDPIYGFFELKRYEIDIVNDPYFSRLHGIKQLGLSSFEYPSASHSRFEHCLGTLHVAEEMCTALLESSDQGSKDIINALKKGKIWRLARLSGLLHDLGHGPYSHTMEELMARNPGYALDLKNELPTLLQWDHGLKKSLHNHKSLEKYLPSKLNEHESFTQLAIIREFDQLVSHLGGDTIVIGLLNVLTKSPHNNVERIVGKIIDGDIDADKIDYLLRDTHHVGFRHTSVDLHDIVKNLRLTRVWIDEKPEWEIGVSSRGVLAVEGLLLTRNRHYDTLATNPDSRRFEIGFIKAFERALRSHRKNTIKRFMYNAYWNQTDEVLLLEAKRRFNLDIRRKMERAAKLEPLIDARWANFLPNTRLDLFTVWRNGPLRKQFEQNLESALSKELGKHNFMVELSYHHKLPATLLVTAIPGYAFLYDYSVLVRDFQEVQFRNGRINVYADRKLSTKSKILDRVRSLIFPYREHGDFYERQIKNYLSNQAESIRKRYHRKLDDEVIMRCRDLDELACLFYLTSDIVEDLNEKYKQDATELECASRFETLGARTKLYKYLYETTKIIPDLVFISQEDPTLFCGPNGPRHFTIAKKCMRTSRS